MFSVAIPIFNHARYLRRAVASALASPLVDEVLLVDDGSSDESPALARELALSHPDKIRDLSEPLPTNKGAHVRLNELCRSATRPWIAVLNSDDIFAPHRFETAELLIRATQCEFLAGSILIVDQDDNPIGRKRGIVDPEFACDLFTGFDGPLDTDALTAVLCNQNILATTSNMVFTRALFDRIGGFADLRYSHDWDFALRATRMGRCLWTPAPLTIYRIHSSNTIKEITPHLNGEVVRFFYRLLNDFPDLESDTLRLLALQANRYLKPFVEPTRAPRFRSIGTNHSAARPSDTAVARRLACATLSMAWFDHSFLLLTDTLREQPGSGELRLITADYLHRLYSGEPNAASRVAFPVGTGRLLRLPGHIGPHADLLLPRLRTSDKVDAINQLGRDAPMRFQPDENLLDLFRILVTPPASNKPRCLILPAFFAVGGVERNTVEIIRELRDDFEFLVVSTERHSEAQGSLVHQLDELNLLSIDLAEVAERNYHLALLACLKEAFNPELIWICNGSPWLVENGLPLRRLFAAIPIIDQQVYDVKEGWIAHYHLHSVQASDHFVAINRRIYEKFVRDLRIPRHRVSLIYSAISPARIICSRVSKEDIPALREKLGFPLPPCRLYAFIARLSPQKRPLRFLDIAKRSQQEGLSDKFILVGGGDLEPDCMEFIQKENLSNLIRIPYSSNTPELLSAVDALVMTSAFEGLPIVLLESLGVGTPAFCTDAGDIGELLNEVQGGGVFSVAMNESETWKEFVRFVQESETFRERTKSRQDEILQRFSSTRISEQYRSCFLRAINETRATPATQSPY